MKNLYCRQWFLCLFVITGLSRQGFAQTLQLGDIQALKSTAFNPNTKTIYAIWNDSIRAYTAPEYKNSRLIKFTPPLEGFGIGKNIVPADSTLYFVDGQGGIVHHLTDDTLTRIDQSFRHKMQINSSLIVRNDTIFRYGGYGFWSHRNFFTYFSKTSKEWELLLPHGTELEPQGVSLAGLTQDRDNFYVLWGLYRKPQELYDGSPYKKAWRFDLNLRRWEFLGEIPRDRPGDEDYIQMGDKLLYFLNNRLILLVEPGKNRIVHYLLSDTRFEKICGSGTCQIRLKGNVNIRGFYSEGLFYLPFLDVATSGTDSPTTRTLSYHMIPESELLANKIKEEPLYVTSHFPLKSTLAGILALGLIGGIVLYQKNRRRQNKIWVLEDGVSYQGQKLPLDSLSLSLIKILLEAQGEIPSQKALELVENPSLSEGHNLKLRSQLVDNINLRFKTLLNTDKDIITLVRSSSDRRNKSYRMDISNFKVQT